MNSSPPPVATSGSGNIPDDTGWQLDPSTRTWHYYPGRLYYGGSVCERIYRTGEPLHAEPASILICQRCLKKMRRLAEKLSEYNREHAKDREPTTEGLAGPPGVPEPLYGPLRREAPRR